AGLPGWGRRQGPAAAGAVTEAEPAVRKRAHRRPPRGICPLARRSQDGVMAAWTAAARAGPAPTPRRRSTSRARPQRRVTGGVFWIGIVAVLLTGIVA